MMTELWTHKAKKSLTARYTEFISARDIIKPEQWAKINSDMGQNI